MLDVENWVDKRKPHEMGKQREQPLISFCGEGGCPFLIDMNGVLLCWAKGLNRKRTAFLWCKTKEYEGCRIFKKGHEKMLAGMMSVSSELMKRVIKPKKFRVVFRVEKIIEAMDETEASEIFFARLSEELADADYTVLDLDIEEFDERVESTKSLQEFHTL